MNPLLLLILLPASVYAVAHYATAATAATAALARGARAECALDIAVMCSAALAAITATLTL